MKRVDGWEKALRAVATEYDRQPFAWGATDCAHFAGDCVRAITGVDVLAPYRGNYESRLDAAARLLFRGHRSVAGAMGAELERHGAHRIDARSARVGDVGITADGVAAVRFPCGFVARTVGGEWLTAHVVKAWSVG